MQPSGSSHARIAQQVPSNSNALVVPAQASSSILMGPVASLPQHDTQMTRPLPDAAVSSHATAGSYIPSYTPHEINAFIPEPVPALASAANVDTAPTSAFYQQLSVLQVEGLEIVREGEALLSGNKRQDRDHDHDLETELGSQQPSNYLPDSDGPSL
jgi:hypothetical protein